MSDRVDAEVLARYELKEKIATGAYGIVWRAVDKMTKQLVAVKKIYDAFENQQDAQRTYREVSYLNKFRGHECIVELIEVIPAANGIDLFLVFEYLDTNMHAVIKEHALKDMPERHFAWIAYQILKALRYLHSASVVHRDLKPGNVLMTKDNEIKLCDFGFARSLFQNNPDRQRVLTDYVSTRWYRAPELLLGSTAYTLSVDMWALGCVLAELFKGEPLFPGESTTDQIRKIVSVTGLPSVADVKALESSQAQPMLESLGIFPSDSVKDVGEGAVLTPRSKMSSLEIIRSLHAKRRETSFNESDQAAAMAAAAAVAAAAASPSSTPPVAAPKEDKLKLFLPANTSADALDFIRSLLRFNPSKRLTVEEALNHVFVQKFRDSMNEPSFSKPLTLPLDDDLQYTIDKYRSSLSTGHEAEDSPGGRERTRSRPAFPLSSFNPPPGHRRLSTGLEFEDPQAARHSRSPVVRRLQLGQKQQ